MENIAEAVAKLLLEIRGIEINVKKPYIFVSNLPSPLYVDCRKIISFPYHRKKIIDILVYFIKNEIGIHSFDVIGGAETAGIPFAAWIAENLEIPMIYVRKKPKTYGKKDQVVGLLKEGERVLMIEDLITFGSSLVNFREGIINAGGIIEHCLAIVSYGHIRLTNVNDFINIHSLTTGQDIANAALSLDYIQKEEYEEIIKWLNDPKKWTEKKGFDWSKVTIPILKDNSA